MKKSADLTTHMLQRPFSINLGWWKRSLGTKLRHCKFTWSLSYSVSWRGCRLYMKFLTLSLREYLDKAHNNWDKRNERRQCSNYKKESIGHWAKPDFHSRAEKRSNILSIASRIGENGVVRSLRARKSRCIGLTTNLSAPIHGKCNPRFACSNDDRMGLLTFLPVIQSHLSVNKKFSW